MYLVQEVVGPGCPCIAGIICAASLLGPLQVLLHPCGCWHVRPAGSVRAAAAPLQPLAAAASHRQVDDARKERWGRAMGQQRAASSGAQRSAHAPALATPRSRFHTTTAASRLPRQLRRAVSHAPATAPRAGSLLIVLDAPSGSDHRQKRAVAGPQRADTADLACNSDSHMQGARELSLKAHHCALPPAAPPMQAPRGACPQRAGAHNRLC